MSLLRNYLNLNGAKSLVSGGVFSVLSRAWTVVFLSTFFDPFLSTVVRHAIPPEVGYSMAVACTIIVIPLLHQSGWQRFLGYLRTLHRRSVREKASLITSLMVGAALVAGLLKGAVFLSSAKGTLGLIVLVVILIGVLQSAARAIKEQRQEQERLFYLPLQQIERWEQQLIILSLLPLLIARGIGLIGVWTAFPATLWWNRLPFFIASVVFLLVLKPERQTFRGLCPRCKQPVPRVLVEMGSCFRCNEALRPAAVQPAKPPR